MQILNADDVKQLLSLKPHPREGGWYVRSYEAAESVAPSQFADGRYAGPRKVCTAIYYLLEPGNFSEMHRLCSDEIFHHYCGGPVEMLQLHPDGRSEYIVLGDDLVEGHRPQVVVPRGTWQGSCLAGEEGWALLGCTVSPGFEYEDYQSATRSELMARWPHEAKCITELTRA